jgi:hypothetical protein
MKVLDSVLTKIFQVKTLFFTGHMQLKSHLNNKNTGR